jgi:RNA polymerase sigma factor (sigma-70 family)
MSAWDSFGCLREGVLAGAPWVADVLYARFARRLVLLARSRLNPRLRAKVDPEDVVQTALDGFFRACAGGHIELVDHDHLWNLLVLFTLRECTRQIDRYQTARRDIRREVSAGLPDDPHAPAARVVAREPAPEETVMLTDIVEQVLTRLDSPVQRRVFELSLQGYTVAEIAAELRYYERGVERARAQARSILTEFGQG